jgi:hypothetical protein
MFVEELDAEIARNLWTYFTAVAQRWPEAWTSRQKGLILNQTTGYRALMWFLPKAYFSIGYEVVPAADFKMIFDLVKLNDADFSPENFKPGTSGQAALYHKLVQDTKVDEDSAWKKIKLTPLDSLDHPVDHRLEGGVHSAAEPQAVF